MSLHTVWIAIDWAYNNLFSFNNWGFRWRKCAGSIVKVLLHVQSLRDREKPERGYCWIAVTLFTWPTSAVKLLLFRFLKSEIFWTGIDPIHKRWVDRKCQPRSSFSMWVSRVDESRCQPREVVNSGKGTRHLCFNLRAFFCGFFVSYNNDEWRFGALIGTSHFGAQASRLQH